MTTKPVNFEGVFPILVTPFDDQEKLDLESLDRVVRFMSDLGVDGVTVLGVLGESNRLVDIEREEVIKTALAAAEKRIPVIVGTSHTGTASTSALSQMAESLGASGVMITPSREPVPNEQKIFEFFQTVAEGISIPIVVQDHPASTLVHMSVPLMLKLVDEISLVACIKEEALPTPQKIAAMIQGMNRRKVPILHGLGALYGLFDLERGGNGFMTGFAFPEVLIKMVQKAKANQMEDVREIYSKYLPLIVFEQQPGLAIRKEIYRMRGLIKSNIVRHPGASINKATTEQLQHLIDSILPGVNLREPIPV
jgi:4-hydroxy-tetrahydrodipicolinate synthase